MSKISNSTANLHERIFAASFGAFLCTLAVTPFDVIKTRLQVINFHLKAKTLSCSKKALEQCETCYPPQSAPKKQSPLQNLKFRSMRCYSHVKGPLQTFSFIVRNEGFFALWRGTSASLLFSIPSSALYLNFYEALRSSKFGSGDNAGPIFSGICARFITTAIMSPAEFLRTRTQSKPGHGGGSRYCTESITSQVRRNGIFHLWRGAGSTLARDVPFSALYWFGYEKLKSFYGNVLPKESPSLISFCSGASSGAMAAFLLTPMDVAKTRIQMDGSKEKTRAFEVAWKILRREGIKEVFRGAVARMLKIPIACAVMISTYEESKRRFAKRRLNFC
ncbi:Carrier protein, mitochondrial [Bonamia ostreae]|uniref:Carrier protein, mitochondrial n=1 Tax=Bonamia ostreae TaxID=126728 RepID=A0ABV2AHR8_9EUKA